MEQVYALSSSYSDAGLSFASTISEERKRQHYTRPGHVSFDERSHQVATLVVENFGRLGVEGSKFIDQLAAIKSVVGGGMVGRWEGKEWSRNA